MTSVGIRRLRRRAGCGWRVQLFRLWTALTVLAACAYLWLYKPEYITWWKRSVDLLIERGSAQLPYPWGDRIESTIGNFGIWVQLTLAILLFRVRASSRASPANSPRCMACSINSAATGALELHHVLVFGGHGPDGLVVFVLHSAAGSKMFGTDGHVPFAGVSPLDRGADDATSPSIAGAGATRLIAATVFAARKCISVLEVAASSAAIDCSGRPHPRSSSAQAACTRSLGSCRQSTSVWMAAVVC